MAAQLRGGGGCNLEEGIDISHSWDVLWNEGFELGVQLCSLWGVAAYVLKQLLQLFAHLEMIILTRVISPEILNTSHELGESIPESTWTGAHVVHPPPPLPTHPDRGTCGPPSPSPPNSPRQGHMWSTLPLPSQLTQTGAHVVLPSQLTQTGAHVVHPPPPLPTHPDRGTCGPPSPSQGTCGPPLPSQLTQTGHMWSTLPFQFTQTGAHVQVVHPPPPFQFTQRVAHMVHPPPPNSPRQGHTCRWSTLPLPSNSPRQGHTWSTLPLPPFPSHPDRGTHASGPPSPSLPTQTGAHMVHPPPPFPTHLDWGTHPDRGTLPLSTLFTHPDRGTHGPPSPPSDRGLPSQLTQTGAPSPSQLT